MNRLNIYSILLLVLLLGFSCKEDVPLNGAKLSPLSLVMLEGSEAQKVYLYLYPSYTTHPDVKWVSDNPNISSVNSDGMVSPLSPGQTTVSVYSGDRRLASCDVTVTPFIHVTSINLNKDNIDCMLGDPSLKLTATVLPDDASDPTVNWSSSAPDIVTVDASGSLTTHAPGTAIITATTADLGKTASCTVVVTYEYVTGVTLSPSNVTAYINGIDRKLTATVLPANASNPAITWSSSNTGVVRVDNDGKLTVLATGTATITVTTVEKGFSASCNVTVKPEQSIGINLLANPGFEDPDDGSDNIAVWSQVPQSWFSAYYTGPPFLAYASAARGSGTFFTTGNGGPIAGVLTEKYTLRLPAASTSGIYQLVDVIPGEEYRFSANVAFRKTNAANQSVKDYETVKILSLDGLTTYGTALIPAQELTVLTITGVVAIPAGVTKVRFQIDQRGIAAPNQAPLLCADECGFYQLIE